MAAESAGDGGSADAADEAGVCPQCGKKFKSALGLEYHVEKKVSVMRYRLKRAPCTSPHHLASLVTCTGTPLSSLNASMQSSSSIRCCCCYYYYYYYCSCYLLLLLPSLSTSIPQVPATVFSSIASECMLLSAQHAVSSIHTATCRHGWLCGCDGSLKVTGPLHCSPEFPATPLITTDVLAIISDHRSSHFTVSLSVWRWHHLRRVHVHRCVPNPRPQKLLRKRPRLPEPLLN